MKTCGTPGAKVVETPANSGRLRAAARNFAGVLGEEREVLAGAVLEHEGDAAGGADAGNRGRREGEGPRRRAAWPSAPLAWRMIACSASSWRLALAPILEGDEEEAAVGRVHAAEQVEAGDAGVVSRTPGVFFRISSTCAITASVRCSEAASGSTTCDEEVALVLLGQEAAGNRLPSNAGEAGDADEQDTATSDLRIRNRQTPT